MRIAVAVAAAALVALVVPLGAGCGAPAPEGLWRDQWLFLGDDGAVVPVGVDRRSAGGGARAEVKGLLGIDGTWRGIIYDAFDLDRGEAADAAAVVARWSERPGGWARGSVETRSSADGEAIDLRVRTRGFAFHVSAPALVPLGSARDPEGEGLYRAGRATLRTEASTRAGWLVVEETPPERPRLMYVDYGDFVFLAAAGRDGRLLVLKDSRGGSAFDDALLLEAGAASARRAGAVDVREEGEWLSAVIPALGLEAATCVAARSGSRGTGPAGAPIRYEVLLLQGEWTGVAFTIRPGAPEAS